MGALKDNNNSIQDTGIRCLECEYNLTGLPGNHCPECGTRFDRNDVLLDPELRRIGTPTHRARGLMKLPAAAATVFSAALMPCRFARQLRIDESPIPPLFVLTFFACYSGLLLGGGWNGRPLLGMLITTLALLFVVIPSSIVLAIFSSTAGSRQWKLAQRIRTFVLMFCYTSWFILAWLWFHPTWESMWRDIWIYWPFVWWPYWSDKLVICSALFYWWSAILFCFVLVRTRPRMLAILMLPLVLAIVRLGLFVYDAIIPRLSR